MEHQIEPSTAPFGPTSRLIVCAHGTRDLQGRRTLAALCRQIAALRPEHTVWPAFVDSGVQAPALREVLVRCRIGGGSSVVVPLLLTSGYHVEQDIPAVVADSGAEVLTAAALGPDPSLLEILNQRLDEAGADSGDAVVLAAVGSRREGARAEVNELAGQLATRRAAPVEVGYLTGGPDLEEAVERLRRRHPQRRVALAPYLLAGSELGQRLRQVGADQVAQPLGDHPLLAELVWQRYDDAVTGAAQESAQG